jgi:aerobic carbon-monoxide dehydrogenase large subunit
MATQLIGERVPRSEDPRLLAGQGIYLDDITPEGTLFAAFVRSPLAHARILSIDVSKALDIEGLVAIYTHEDLGDLGEPLPLTIPNPGLTRPRTQRPLAKDEVRFVGELVAMVVASDRYVAEDIVDTIGVEYDSLPVVIGVENALAGKTAVHSDIPDNIAAKLVQNVGDAEKAMAAAPHRLTRRIKLERSAATPIETRGVVAVYESDAGHLTVFDSTQSPTTIKAAISSIFGLPEHKVDVVAPDVGGGFGVKLPSLYPEEFLIPFAAMTLGRPVKWTEDRREHFIGSNHERGQVHEVEVGFDDEGRILALRDGFAHDSGAYCPYGVIVPLVTSARMIGPYKIPNYHCDVTVVYTNTLAVSPYRGAGMPQGAFVMERTLDAIARELDLDRGAVRLTNFIQPHEFPYNVGVIDEDGTEMIYDSGDYEKGLRMVLDMIGYEDVPEEKKDAERRKCLLGVGLGCYVEGTGSGPYEGVRIHLEPTGKVYVTTGIGTQGQGHETVFAQVAASELGVPVEDVTVRTGDTRQFKWATGTFASRSAVVVGMAVASAARAIRRRSLDLAATALEVSPEDLEIENGIVSVRGAQDVQIPLRQVAILANPLRYAFSKEALAATQFVGSGKAAPSVAESSPGLEATIFNAPARATFASGSHAAVVEIDPDAATLRILRYVAAHDCGTIINPTILEGQIHGGIAQGIGGAFYERMHYEEETGQLLNASFMDFLMPYATEIPPIEVGHVVTPSPLNPLGIKGAGEAGAILPPAVIVAAIEDALGIEITEVPLSPQRVFELLADLNG